MKNDFTKHSNSNRISRFIRKFFRQDEIPQKIKRKNGDIKLICTKSLEGGIKAILVGVAIAELIVGHTR